MKRCVILINPYFKLKSFLNQPIRLKEELEKLGVETSIATTGEYTVMMEDNVTKSNLTNCDFAIYLDKDKYYSRMLEKTGMRLFNSHDAVVACDDKMETIIRLSDHGITMPDTIPGALCFTKDASITEMKERIEFIINRLGFPCIAKECYGSLGSGVYKVETREQLIACMEKLMNRPHLFQKMISESYGKDVRVIVIGGKAIGAIVRQADGDFRSNLELGGTARPFMLTNTFQEAAEKCAKILGLDYCGVDLLFGEGDMPVVCEVNSNAFFGGFESVTGINVAGEYARYIHETMYHTIRETKRVHE